MSIIDFRSRLLCYLKSIKKSLFRKTLSGRNAPFEEKIIIGLLSTNLKPVPFYKIDNNLPIELVKFTEKGINWKKKTIKGITLKGDTWQPVVTKLPQAVYNRCYTSSTNITSRLEELIGLKKVFNGFTRFDKYVVYSILKRSKLKSLLIPTYPYETKTLVDLLENTGKVLIKPRKGALGSGIYHFTVENGLYRLHIDTIHPIKVFKTSTELINYLECGIDQKDYIIQPFIQFSAIDSQVFDLRMLVQKTHKGTWAVTADMSRVSYKSFFTTNLAQRVQPIYKTLEATKYMSIIPKLKRISIKIAKILEKKLCSLGEISVDFGISTDGKLWLIEVNGKPEKTIFSEIDEETQNRVFITPLQYATYLAKNC